MHLIDTSPSGSTGIGERSIESHNSSRADWAAKFDSGTLASSGLEVRFPAESVESLLEVGRCLIDAFDQRQRRTV